MTFDEFLQRKYPELVNCTGQLTVDVEWLRKFWERAMQPDRPEPKWVAVLRYNQGLGNKFVNLGEIAGGSYDEALKEAEQRGASYVDKQFGKDTLLGWEVKVRPDSSLG